MIEPVNFFNRLVSLKILYPKKTFKTFESWNKESAAPTESLVNTRFVDVCIIKTRAARGKKGLRLLISMQGLVLMAGFL